MRRTQLLSVAGSPTSAEAVLEASHAEGERRGVRYSYTRPSPSRYPWQWYWDSCFAAIVWRRFDPQRPRDELSSLLNAMRPDGFIGHVIFWDQPLTWKRLVYYNVTSRHAEMTEHDPAAAARLGVAAGGRRPGDGAADRHPPRVAAGATATSRATGCCGWCSPTSRASTPRRSSTRSGAGSCTAATASRCWSPATGSLGWDARRIRDRGWPVVCEVMTNVLWCLARVAAGRAVDHAGDRRPALGRAPRPLPRRGPARRRPARRLDLGRALAARAPRPAGGDRPPAGRASTCSTRSATGSRTRRPRSRPPSRAFEPNRGPGWKLPLLARADLGQRRLDAVAGHAAARLRG